MHGSRYDKSACVEALQYILKLISEYVFRESDYFENFEFSNYSPLSGVMVSELIFHVEISGSSPAGGAPGHHVVEMGSRLFQELMKARRDSGYIILF